MTTLCKPERIFTHESDLDGLLSGLLLRSLADKVFGESIRIESHHYPSWRMRTLREHSAWVSDFTFEQRMDRTNWLVLDHHTTDVKAEHCDLIHDITKSASLLCYELCKEHGVQSEKLDRIVHLSNVADLYIESDPDFELAIDYANLVKNYGFWNLYSLIKGNAEALLDHPLLEVMRTKRSVENPIGLNWSRNHIHRVTSEFGIAETVVGDANSIVHQLLDEPSCKYKVLATMYVKANRSVMVSFRSLGGGALGIAKQFQGGGHANACGATLPRSVGSTAEAVVYMKQVLEPAPGSSQGLSSLEDAFASLNLS
jgi:oligoribonuclease NrnB/cAMP/cGMP phosphodiesterase (DHH superfamily)